MRSIVINAKGRIPYGVSSWNQMRSDRCIYVDRTKAIAQLDATTIHSCLWRPRRTGKTLLANQLEKNWKIPGSRHGLKRRQREGC